MNIIIPLGGVGQRFIDDGYTMPKPLISVLGDPLIFHVIANLSLSKDDTIYIVYNESLDAFMFRDIVRRQFPLVRFIPLAFGTRGAVETVLCGLNHVEDLSQKTLVIDGDTFYPLFGLMWHARSMKNAIFYFTDTQTDPIYSYISIHENHVTEIKEKEKISDNACTGAYLFSDGNLLKRAAEVLIAGDNKQCGEYYMSGLYEILLTAGDRVMAQHVLGFHCLGTPNQLKAYCMKYAGITSRGFVYSELSDEHKKYYQSDKKRFCFDLDNTICTYPSTPGDYSTVRPIFSAIDRIKFLHAMGHKIIIQTARGMKSGRLVSGKVHEEVFAFLREYSVPYDEIYFGKPHADFYIDDLAVKTTDDIDKAIGFYNGQVEPRGFNKIEMGDDWVVKTTQNPGEIYWYDNIPEVVKDHFTYARIFPDGRIGMDRINGVPLTYLFINGSLTKADIDLLFATTHKIHICMGKSPIVGHEVLYGNYSEKVKQRYDSFDYCGILRDADGIYNTLMSNLAEYEQFKCSMPGVIHGDMVFSNIFLCEPRLLKFIDMRGRVGEVNTIYGDIFYDYAKVYQSLCGYDYIMMGRENGMSDYNKELLRYFESKFRDLFGGDRLAWLRKLTASLFFSLIPLHTDPGKQKLYLKMAQSLL